MKNSCLASLVAFILMIFLTIFILASQIKNLTAPQFWLKALDKNELLTQLSSSVDALALSQRESGQENLNATALTKVILKTITPALLSDQTDKALVAFFDYARGKTTTIDETIDLSIWKENLKTQWPIVAPTVFRAEYDKLPACKDGDKPDKIIGEEVVINCKSPDLSAESIEESAKNADLGPLLTLIPDQYSLGDLVKQNQPVFDRIRLAFNVVNIVFWLSLIISLLSAAGLIALGWPNWRAISGWVGWVILIAAAPFLILELFNQKMMQVVETLLSSRLDQNITQVVSVTLENFNQTLVQSTIGLTATLACISIVLIILSFVLPKYEPKVSPPGFK